MEILKSLQTVETFYDKDFYPPELYLKHSNSWQISLILTPEPLKSFTDEKIITEIFTFDLSKSLKLKNTSDKQMSGF